RHTSFSRDWSSDVCSSDLLVHPVEAGHALFMQEGVFPPLDRRQLPLPQPCGISFVQEQSLHSDLAPGGVLQCINARGALITSARSEERRVGKREDVVARGL